MESKELSPIDDLKITQSLLQILLSDDMNDIRIEKIKSIFESRESTFKKQIDELQSQLAEKDKLYNDLLFRYDERSNALSYSNLLATNLKSENTALKSTVFNSEANLELVQSELTSLKEKHNNGFNVPKNGFEIVFMKNDLATVNGKGILLLTTDDYNSINTQTHEKE